jgi:ribosomal protein S18 acetylase RimI-like enzyme
MSGARRTGADPELTIRRATEADVPGIVRLYAGLSPESRRMRFFGSMPEASLQAAAGLDDDEALSVLALVGARVVGEARCVRHGDGQHELAVAVADDAQHRGVGGRLLDALRQEAAAHGIERLCAVVRVDNLAMLRTLRSAGSAVVEPADDMLVVLEVSCVEEMPGWSAARAGRRVLVEVSSVWDDRASAALREAGFDVRQCLGPRRGVAQTCPLVLSGRCRLAEEADVVACLLPEDDASCREVAENHASQRPDRLVARTVAEWRAAAPRLVRSARRA